MKLELKIVKNVVQNVKLVLKKLIIVLFVLDLELMYLSVHVQKDSMIQTNTIQKLSVVNNVDHMEFVKEKEIIIFLVLEKDN